MGIVYPSPMVVLEALRDLLGAVSGVQTARIGIEAGLAPDDYPIVRVVPSAGKPSEFGLAGLRAYEVLVYFGKPIAEADSGLEDLYSELYAMEIALIAALPDAGDWVARWQETITDEDRVPGYKLMALRLLIDG